MHGATKYRNSGYFKTFKPQKGQFCLETIVSKMFVSSKQTFHVVALAMQTAGPLVFRCGTSLEGAQKLKTFSQVALPATTRNHRDILAYRGDLG